MPRFHKPARLPHRLEERAADAAQHGRDVHVAQFALRTDHRMAAAKAVVPQVRLGVAFKDLADDLLLGSGGSGRWVYGGILLRVPPIRKCPCGLEC